ncbi:DNA-binding transcriptional LysR family regulator [Rhizobium sp. BK313]|jgi:DNA-binding transcriptional LysR family regulator|uniref:LysR family transcriptional regulator n=1 Tax=Rhizobium sp. BK313 TaxID=2587081 RepID=UPI00105D7733|nr:LysR family transcriptional regulator [Rhizobium sp. BK313]MBB3458024.1 DNA-binding transcriptional LysR family regulator [Rhizobium sp. BK313]
MALDKLDFRLLRIFSTIVEAGGFSAAQGELNLSLATISSHISALEDRLGLVLCRRGRSGFSLTPEGRAVYDEVLRLLGTLDQFDARMRGLRDRLTGTLTIGLTDNTISDPNSPLEDVLGRFSDEAPDVSLNIVTKPPHELLRDVIAGQVQIAIASFPRITLGLTYTDLYVENQRFYCGRGHPLFAMDEASIDVNEVRRHNIVARSYWGSRDLKVFAISSPRAVVSDMEAEARLILSGRYLGYLPEHYAKQFVEAGQMRSLRPDLFGYKAPFQAAHDPAQMSRGIVPLFLKILTGGKQKTLPAKVPA